MALSDTSLRPICFGIDKIVLKDSAKMVGPENFKRYEHILYLMAQLSRIVYCDTGIMQKVIEKSLGLSNDVVNKVITAYDSKYNNTRKTPITSQFSQVQGRPMESYALGSGSGQKYGTYISSPEDMTCLILNASKIKANPNSILLPSDVVITFKGSSTIDNFKHDLQSQFTAADLQGLITSTGIKVQGEKNIVTGAFIKPLINAWSSLMKSLNEHCTSSNIRLFLTGHSLGGAYASLFAFILAEGKLSNTLPIMNKIKSIHLVSFGAPCILSDTARNTFNKHLDSGLITLDRVVSQKVASVMPTAGLSGNDIIPNIPAGFSHPGFRPLATEIRPEANGRPYSIDNVRKLYGVETKTRYREPTTWPFLESVNLGDRAKSSELKSIVSKLTGESVIPDEIPVVAQDIKEAPTDPTALQEGGLFGFGAKSQKSIYSDETKKHIPNFLSVSGSIYAAAFAHGEYLGMFFMGGFRLPGMKNPGAGTSTAYFELFPNGVGIKYDTFKGSLRINAPQSKGSQSMNSLVKAPIETSTTNEDPQAGGRKTRKSRKSKSKRSKKTRRYFRS